MSYKIVGKYIKELNFSLLNSETFYSLSQEISNYKINIDIKSLQIKKNIIEVLTTLQLKPVKDDLEKINTKVVFATIIELTDGKMSKTDLERVILVNIPKETYSELRDVFVSLFEKSGFTGIKINENVDFEKLYNLKRSQ